MTRAAARPLEGGGAEIDHFDRVLDCFPARLQEETLAYAGGLEEIYLDAGRKVAFRAGRVVTETRCDATLADVHYIRDKLGGFRSHMRAGLSRTLHRFSGVQDDEKRLVGITVRLGRHVFGVAELLRPYLGAGDPEKQPRILLVGPPGSGKTTLLRDVVRVLGERYSRQAVAIDTSNEIGGEGSEPHLAVGQARVFKVGDPERQEVVLNHAIRSHTPAVIVVDEIGYQRGDVVLVKSTPARGVGVVATLHGRVLADVIYNPMFWPVLGDLEVKTGKRPVQPTFDIAVEVRGKEKLLVHENLAEAIDRQLAGETLKGKKLGAGWL